MLCKSYTNRYIIALLCLIFSLGVQDNRAAAKAITYPGSVSQLEGKVVTQEEQKELLDRLLKAKGLPKGIKGSKIIGIIGKKEPEKAEVVKEISPLNQELSDIERRLSGSLYVSTNDLKKIGSELYGSIQQKLKELPLHEEETVSLRERAMDLAGQLRMFETLVKIEDVVNRDIHEQKITSDGISNVEKGLEGIKSEVRDRFRKSSSFNQRMANLEQVIKQQRVLLALTPDQRKQAEILKMERYLTLLENALKKDDIRLEIIKNIRISLDEMADPKKLNLPPPQQTIITKRIDNLKQLLGIFDYLLHMEDVVKQKDLSSAMAEGIAEGLRSVKKDLEPLSLPKDLSDSANKQLVRVNNRLVPKLPEYLDQLERDTIAISTLSQLAETENRFKLLQKLRENLDMTENQERNVDEKLVELKSLLDQQRDSLLEQQKELERFVQEQEQDRQIALQKEKELQEKKELEEREREQENELEKARQKEEQKTTRELTEKLNTRKEKIREVEQEIESLVPEFRDLIDDWRKVQDQENRLRASYMMLQRRTTEGEQRTLKNLEEMLERKKSFMTSYVDSVNAIHKKIFQLYKENEKINSNNEDLTSLLNSWVSALEDLRKQIVKDKQLLLMETNRKKSEQKSFSIGFINRNELVLNELEALILLVDRMRIADDNKLVLIERAIQERNRPIKAPRPKRQGAFSQYF